MALIFEEYFNGADAAAVITEIETAINTPGTGVHPTGVHTLVAGDIVTGRGGGATDFAVNITGSKYLKYPISAGTVFNFGKGAIQMWVKPNWDTRLVQSSNIHLFSATWGTTQKLELWLCVSNQLMFRPYFYNAGATLPFSSEPFGIQQWRTDAWGLMELYWDLTHATDSFILFKFNDRYHSWNAQSQFTDQGLQADKFIFIGSSTSPGSQFNGIVDSVKIWNDPVDLLPVSPTWFPRTKFYNPWPWAADTVVTVGTCRKALTPDDYIYKVIARAGDYKTGAVEPAWVQTIGATTDDDTNVTWICLPGMAHLFPDGDGFCSTWETNATNPTDCALLAAGGDDIRWFKRPHLENVYPGYVPTAGDEAGPWTWTGFPGETIPIIFNVYSRNALTGVQVSAGDFSGPGAITNVNNMRIVKNWWQGTDDGGYGHLAVPTMIGSMCVNDDTIALETDISLYTTKAPTIPDLDYAKTVLAAGTSRQFILEVTIPTDAVAGTYTATLNLIDDAAVNEDKIISLVVKPYSLRETGITQLYAIDPSSETGIVSTMGLDRWDIFDKQLDAIVKLGYNGVRLTCYVDQSTTWSAANIHTAIHAVAAKGIDTLVLYTTYGHGYHPTAAIDADDKAEWALRYTSELVGWMEDSGFTPYFLAEDEFDFQDTTKCAQTGNRWLRMIYKAKLIHAAGGKVYVYANYPDCVAAYMAAVATYNVADFTGYGDLAGDASIDAVDYQRANCGMLTDPATVALTPALSEGFYWQTRDGNVRWHRALTGFQSNANNVRPSPNLFNTPGTCWNEFNATYCADGITFPSVANATDAGFRVIPSYNYYAIMEGVRDHKLIATWEYYYNRVAVSNPIVAATSLAAVNAILVHYIDDGTGTVANGRLVDYSQWDTDRAAIIDEIDTLRGYDTTVTHRRSVISNVITAMWKRFRKIGGVRQ
jgi:hypothetical protein